MGCIQSEIKSTVTYSENSDIDRIVLIDSKHRYREEIYYNEKYPKISKKTVTRYKHDDSTTTRTQFRVPNEEGLIYQLVSQWGKHHYLIEKKYIDGSYSINVHDSMEEIKDNRGGLDIVINTMYYTGTRLVKRKCFYQQKEFHRDGGLPAFIEYDREGNVLREKWYDCGILTKEKSYMKGESEKTEEKGE